MITVRLSYEGSVWVCNAVYASPIPSVKDRLWEHLGMDSQHISNPWMVLGYFNEILHSSEVRGGLFNHCNLQDLGAIGHKHTWFRSKHGGRNICKRLDRVIADVR